MNRHMLGPHVIEHELVHESKSEAVRMKSMDGIRPALCWIILVQPRLHKVNSYIVPHGCGMLP